MTYSNGNKSNSGEMEMITFVHDHVFESATAQDSSSVLAKLDDVFGQLNTNSGACSV